MCNPCLRTLLLPMSPTPHIIESCRINGILSTPRPWQIRPVDARHEKGLRSPKSSHRSVQLVPKIDEIVRDTVRQLAVGLSPNELRRVELRRVRGEVVSAQPRMLGDEGLNFSTSMGPS